METDLLRADSDARRSWLQWNQTRSLVAIPLDGDERGARYLRRDARFRVYEAPAPKARTPRSCAAQAAIDLGVCNAYRIWNDMRTVLLVERAVQFIRPSKDVNWISS